MLWLVACSSVFKACIRASSELSASLVTSALVTSPLTLTFQFPSYKEPCDFTGSTQIIRDNLFFSKALISSLLQSLFFKFFCHVRDHIHRGWGLGHGQFGDYYAAFHKHDDVGKKRREPYNKFTVKSNQQISVQRRS